MAHKSKLTTPVLFLVFNRPDVTKKVFAEIKKAKPEKLFIAADGPRNPEEKKKTDEVRKIVSNIDWPCKVKRLFRNENLGCKYAVSSAIDWFFENEEQGIILEDDCLPSKSFFRFCQELLEKYKNDERIMHISGTNVKKISRIKEDYFFSETYNVWGWATWRRAWQKYDVEMKNWPKWRLKIFKFMKDYSFFNKFISFRLYELTYQNKIDTWDYQWDFICKIKNGLSIIPRVNLITNLGFLEGTHTTNYKKKEKSLKKFEIEFPLVKNNNVLEDKKYLKKYFRFFKKNLLTKIKNMLN